MRESRIYHICARTAWEDAVRAGRYDGSAQDQRDGFIHFSTAAQVAVSAAKHHAGTTDRVLLAVDPARVEGEVRWEASRGGALFPHLYGGLRPQEVIGHWDLPLGADGRHVFPDLTMA